MDLEMITTLASSGTVNDTMSWLGECPPSSIPWILWRQFLFEIASGGVAGHRRFLPRKSYACLLRRTRRLALRERSVQGIPREVYVV